MITAYDLHMLIEGNGIPITGVAYQPNGVTYDNATAPQITTGDALAAGFEALTVSADKTSITADGVDESVITCGLTDFDYMVWKNGYADENPLSGSIADGNLELSATEAATYKVRLYDPVTHECGFIEIEAV